MVRVEKVEEVETFAYGSLGLDLSRLLSWIRTSWLRASQVETIWVFVGFLLHYSTFGILHSIFCKLNRLKKLIRSQASLVEKVETFAFGSLG